MTKQPKPWVESMLVAYVDNELESAQMAAVEEIIREDPEARAIVAVLRRSRAAVRAAFDRPLDGPVPERLLAAVGAESSAIQGNVVPLRPMRLGNRATVMALAASLAALVIGFGAGYWQAAPGDGIRLAGSSADGTESGQYEAALYQALENSNPGTQISYVVDAAKGRRGAVTIVGPVPAGVGGDCLEFRREWSNAGSDLVSRGLACRSDTGEWSVLSMPAKPAS